MSVNFQPVDFERIVAQLKDVVRDFLVWKASFSVYLFIRFACHFHTWKVTFYFRCVGCFRIVNDLYERVNYYCSLCVGGKRSSGQSVTLHFVVLTINRMGLLTLGGGICIMAAITIDLYPIWFRVVFEVFVRIRVACLHWRGVHFGVFWDDWNHTSLLLYCMW